MDGAGALAARVASGTHREQLEALRDFLLRELKGAAAGYMSRDMAPLATQLRDVYADLGAGRAELVGLRDFLTEQLDMPTTGSRDVAPMTAQLKIVLADLDAMPREEGESVVDEIARRRAARLAATAGSAPADTAGAAVREQRRA